MPNKALEQTAGLLPALTSLVDSIAKIALVWKTFNFPRLIESKIESVGLAVLDGFNQPAAAQLDRSSRYISVVKAMRFNDFFETRMRVLLFKNNG